MKKKRSIFLKIVKIALVSLALILIIGTILMIAFSPYEKTGKGTHKKIVVTVDIASSPAAVFSYLGNSKNAEDWSVFVDHITPLNPEKVADGKIGSIRRCFKDAEEQKGSWDEEILAVELNKYRKLSCFNFRSFELSADNLQTEQIYQTKSNGTTRLKFTLFFEPGKSSWLDELKMYYASYEIRSIFEANLQNIKRLVEAKN
jgi:uncharacterized protein YndB with AHSA1/START domain